MDEISNIVDELIKHGYVGFDTIAAVNRFIDQGYGFVRLNSILLNTMETIEQSIPYISGLPVGFGESLMRNYRTAYTNLFNQSPGVV